MPNSLLDIRKTLKLDNYYSILSKNEFFSVCLSIQANKPKRSFFIRQQLIRKNFCLKFIHNSFLKRFSIFKNISYFFHGNIFFIYKENMDHNDFFFFKRFINDNNIRLVFFSFRNKFYFIEKLKLSFKKLSQTKIIPPFFNLYFILKTSFFLKLSRCLKK